MLSRDCEVVSTSPTDCRSTGGSKISLIRKKLKFSCVERELTSTFDSQLLQLKWTTTRTGQIIKREIYLMTHIGDHRLKSRHSKVDSSVSDSSNSSLHMASDSDGRSRQIQKSKPIFFPLNAEKILRLKIKSPLSKSKFCIFFLSTVFI